MCEDLTKIFLKHCHMILRYRGAYGEVNIDRDARGVPFVRKRALVSHHADSSDEARELTLSKEYVILKYVSGSHVAPEVLFAERKEVCVHNQQQTVPLVKEIHMEFVGPTIQTCNILGFLIEPRILLEQLLAACSYLHHLKVLHLDLKPDNVTYHLESERVKLIDFGFAEMTGFKEMETEAGIRKWQKPPSFLSWLTFGQVEKGGTLGLSVEEGTPYFQNNFNHVQVGSTRLKHLVNIPGYRDPACMCSHWLDCGSGMVVDEKTDIFAIGMIVFTHLQSCEILNTEERKGSVSFLVPKVLKSICRVRGCCTRLEAWQMENLLRKSAMICGVDLNDSVNIARLAVIKTVLLGDGKTRGLFQHLAHVLGERVTGVVLDMLHPVPSFRPSATEAISRLTKQLCHRKSIPTEMVKTVTVCDQVQHILTGRLFENGVCILSLSVDIVNKQIMWQKGIEHFKRRSDNEKSSLMNELVREMHMRSHCCDQNNHHHHRWYKTLGQSHMLCNDYW